MTNLTGKTKRSCITQVIQSTFVRILKCWPICLLLYTCTGLFSSVLSYVLQSSKVDTLSLMCAKEGGEKAKRQAAIIRQRTVSEWDDSDHASIEAVCMECFKFLKALAKDFYEVQVR